MLYGDRVLNWDDCIVEDDNGTEHPWSERDDCECSGNCNNNCNCWCHNKWPDYIDEEGYARWYSARYIAVNGDRM